MFDSSATQSAMTSTPKSREMISMGTSKEDDGLVVGKKKSGRIAGITRKSGLVIIVLLACMLIAAPTKKSIPTEEESMARKEDLQVIHGPAVTFMGSDSLNKGYNFLRGAGADPRYARALGQFTVTRGKTLEYGETVYQQPDQIDLTMNAGCQSNGGSRSVQSTASVSSVKAEATASSESYSAQAEVSYGSKGGLMAKLTGVRPFSVTVGGGFALMFGRSNGQSTARSKFQSGYFSSSTSWVQSTLFSTFVDWMGKHTTPSGTVLHFDYEKEFLAIAGRINAETNSVTAQGLVLELFERWGTHVISEATYGTRCSSTLFMKTDVKSSAASDMVQEAGSSRLEWNAYMSGSYGGLSGSASTTGSKSKQFERSTQTSGMFNKQVSYEISNVRCEGYLRDNLCNKRFSGADDNPVMIEYTPLEIWLVRNAGGEIFSSNGKKNIFATLKAIGDEFFTCATAKCGGKGFCVMSPSFWDGVREGKVTSVASSFTETSCVCKNDAVGIGCAIGREQVKDMLSQGSDKTNAQGIFFRADQGNPAGTVNIATLYTGSGTRTAYYPVTFSKRMCDKPKVALATSSIDAAAPADVYWWDISQKDANSLGMTLQIGGWQHSKVHSFTITSFASCDGRIEMGTVSKTNNPGFKKRCSGAQGNLVGWAGFRHVAYTSEQNMVVSFDKARFRVSADVWNPGSSVGYAHYYADYAVWCDGEIPPSRMQTGNSGVLDVNNGVATQFVLFPGGWMGCVPRVIVSIRYLHRRRGPMAMKVAMSAKDVKRYGFTVQVNTWGHAHFHASANWLATC